MSPACIMIVTAGRHRRREGNVSSFGRTSTPADRLEGVVVSPFYFFLREGLQLCGVIERLGSSLIIL